MSSDFFFPYLTHTHTHTHTQAHTHTHTHTHRYSLRAVVSHHGKTVGHGHYTSCIRHNGFTSPTGAGLWLHIDDHTLTEVPAAPRTVHRA